MTINQAIQLAAKNYSKAKAELASMVGVMITVEEFHALMSSISHLEDGV